MTKPVRPSGTTLLLIRSDQQQQREPSPAHQSQQSQQDSQLQATQPPRMTSPIFCGGLGRGRAEAVNLHPDDMSDIDCFDW